MTMLPKLRPALLAIALQGLPLPALAAVGIFEHGNGIQSLGMGGVGYAIGGEATILVTNPAHAAALGSRADLGVSVFSPLSNARFEGNALGADTRHRTDAKRYYNVPQGGFVMQVSDRFAVGASMFTAGLGPDYPESPYQRFGGEPRASLNLGSAGVAATLAWQATERHAFGGSLNVGYQTVRIRGAGFLGGLSTQPERVSNQGKDGSGTLGFTLGWVGRLSTAITAGASYRSKTWTEKHDEYAGLLPEGGRLELPAIWGLGVAVEANPRTTLALDYQRYEYASEKAFGNRLNRLDAGHLLGSRDGPGFGLKDHNVWKFGAEFAATPRLTLRAGFIRASQVMQESETLFAVFGTLPTRDHYTLGATWQVGPWDLSGYGFHAPDVDVQGEGSIPAAFGGGEIHVSNSAWGGGLTLGRRFGGDR